MLLLFLCCSSVNAIQSQGTNANHTDGNISQRNKGNQAEVPSPPDLPALANYVDGHWEFSPLYATSSAVLDANPIAISTSMSRALVPVQPPIPTSAFHYSHQTSEPVSTSAFAAMPHYSTPSSKTSTKMITSTIKRSTTSTKKSHSSTMSSASTITTAPITSSYMPSSSSLGCFSATICGDGLNSCGIRYGL